MGSNDGLDCRETSDSIAGRGQVTEPVGFSTNRTHGEIPILRRFLVARLQSSNFQVARPTCERAPA